MIKERIEWKLSNGKKFSYIRSGEYEKTDKRYACFIK